MVEYIRRQCYEPMLPKFAPDDGENEKDENGDDGNGDDSVGGHSDVRTVPMTCTTHLRAIPRRVLTERST